MFHNLCTDKHFLKDLKGKFVKTVNKQICFTGNPSSCFHYDITEFERGNDSWVN